MSGPFPMGMLTPQHSMQASYHGRSSESANSCQEGISKPVPVPYISREPSSVAHNANEDEHHSESHSETRPVAEDAHADSHRTERLPVGPENAQAVRGNGRKKKTAASGENIRIQNGQNAIQDGPGKDLREAPPQTDGSTGNRPFNTASEQQKTPSSEACCLSGLCPWCSSCCIM
ncbi:hypothetical protein CYLTODRAFT_419940 [Cylindrobasidium torrendii FP15055 ss-10]|uniref:Uncharacterized protein n=1 Tax=Cylindrobasidium torrendii FP15055 ss-10 TaxID=1314674 RepID=A0A0D7BKU0_9AGAR|nr:hypothetical protein CYLTODRAFT_419940 [Cylindrobasidium torrendii FP15055 ss-10]